MRDVVLFCACGVRKTELLTAAAETDFLTKQFRNKHKH